MDDYFHILIFEEDENLKSILEECMQTDCFRTDIYSDIQEVAAHFDREEYVLYVIDASTPNVGYDILDKFKTCRSDIPVIFIGKNLTKELILRAYQMGTDDYIRKPFSVEELQARMRAILKRTHPVKTKEVPTYQLGDFVFDTYKQTLTIGNVCTRLTTKELELLKLLCRYANQLVERSQALKMIWKDDSYFNARSMDVYITKLRRLLKADPKVRIINVHGKGYRLEIRQNKKED